MNTRSQISLTNTSLRDLQLPPKQRQTNTTKSSSSSNTSSSPMNSKNNSDNDPSDDTNLHKQLELKSSAVIEEQTETDNSLYSNQPIQEQKETFQNNVDQVHNLNDNHSNDSDEKPSLRDFLRCYITIFSGNENALQWFTQTDLKFSELNLSFNDRLEILPNFLTGCALLWFSSNRDKIKCYMDFCQLFNVEYVNSKPTPESHISSQCSNRHSLINSQVINNKDFIDKPTDHSGNITTPLTHHHIPSTDSNNSTLSHPTSSTISKALIDKFVKDPIKFYGGKDSVINWLDEIEQQFHNMQLCESDKLNLIQICLKGDAQQWYRQNKKYFSSWSKFVTEIKKSYHSNLQRDIAFKKLQQYHQTPHQSVFQYYNEMLKLIQQADPDMNENTKVHYLMNGLRPSLSIETRRNYPKTTQEFLSQAKIAEDLTSLNTTFINQSMIHDDSHPSISSTYSNSTNYTTTNEFNDYNTNSMVNNDYYNNSYSYDNNHSYDNNYSSDNNNNQHHYLNRIFKPSSSNSYDRNQSSNSLRQSFNGKPSSSNLSSSSFNNKTYRNNNPKQPQPFQRCSICGASDHIARHCHRFGKRSQ